MKAAVSWQILVGMAALPGRASLLLSKSRSLFFPFPVPLVHQGLPISLSGSATGATPAGETGRTTPVLKMLTVWLGETDGHIGSHHTETVDVTLLQGAAWGDSSLGWRQGWFLAGSNAWLWSCEPGEGMGELPWLNKCSAGHCEKPSPVV